jgi:ribonuclease HI
VKNAELKPLFQDVMRRLRAIGPFAIHHVPREKNRLADKLANMAIDEMGM